MALCEILQLNELKYEIGPDGLHAPPVHTTRKWLAASGRHNCFSSLSRQVLPRERSKIKKKRLKMGHRPHKGAQ